MKKTIAPCTWVCVKESMKMAEIRKRVGIIPVEMVLQHEGR